MICTQPTTTKRDWAKWWAAAHTHGEPVPRCLPEEAFRKHNLCPHKWSREASQRYAPSEEKTRRNVKILAAYNKLSKSRYALDRMQEVGKAFGVSAATVSGVVYRRAGRKK